MSKLHIDFRLCETTIENYTRNNCEGCTNSSDCKDCKDCDRCSYCENCVNCIRLSHCIDCIDCEGCENCINCINVNFGNYISNLKNIIQYNNKFYKFEGSAHDFDTTKIDEYIENKTITETDGNKDCVNCFECIGCVNCKNCVNCVNCKNMSNCYGLTYTYFDNMIYINDKTYKIINTNLNLRNISPESIQYFIDNGSIVLFDDEEEDKYRNCYNGCGDHDGFEYINHVECNDKPVNCKDCLEIMERDVERIIFSKSRRTFYRDPENILDLKNATSVIINKAIDDGLLLPIDPLVIQIE